MKRVALLVSALAVSVLTIQAAPQRGNPKPPANTPVPLSVTIDGTACAICPDGSGDPYVDGEEGVSAELDQYGNLVVIFGSRSVEFQFAETVPPGGSYSGSNLATRFSPALQSLVAGTSACAEMNWAFRDGTTEYRLLFHRTGYPTSVVDVTSTSFAVVMRVDADTWEVEPRAEDCNTGAPALAAVVSLPTRGKVVYTNHGSEAMPFKLTLTRQ